MDERISNFEKPSTVNLITTYRCNYQCRHCISDCHPNRLEEMGFLQAKRYIDNIVVTTQVSDIGYTGGEPFLAFHKMKKLMDYTYQEYGIPGGAVTNSFWASNTATVKTMLKELFESGLRSLVVSCDDFHLEYVSIENIQRVVHEALELGILVNINTVVTRKGSITKHDIPKLLSFSQDSIPQGLTLKEFGPLLLGRAGREISPTELIETEDESYFNAPCPFVGVTPTITPSGNVYACCCFGDDTLHPEQRIGYCGNAEEEPMDIIFDNMKTNLLLNLLATSGPLFLLKMIKQSNPGIQLRGRYLSNCDICVELFHQPEIRYGLADMLEKISMGGRVNV